MPEDKDRPDTVGHGESESADEYEKVCFLCRRPESKAGKMIELPNNIHICMDCMQKSFDSMNNGNINYTDLINNLPPNMGMIDLSSLQNRVPERQRLKKRKEEKKESKKSFSIKDIPPPHKIKKQLDDYITIITLER